MSKTPSDEDVFTNISYRPDDLLGPMITIDEPAKPSTLERRPVSSPLGLLDSLPLEVLHNGLHILDFQSLSRLSLVSQRGRITVESLPIYRDLMKYIPDTLAALGESNLLSHYSADRLYTVLRSKACVARGKFGTFLFLLTCERCCHECLAHNQSFWALPLSKAQTIYRIPTRELKKLPTMKSIPGVYKTREIKRQRPKLVSVFAAAQLAKINGSMPMLNTTIKTPDMPSWKTLPDWLQDEHSAAVQEHLDTLTEPLTGHPSWLLPSTGIRKPDQFCGMASMQFPYLLPDKTLEHGLLCKGCEWVFSRFKSDDLPAHALNDMGLSGRIKDSIFRTLEASSLRAMLKSEFLAHVVVCYGAGQLLSTLDIGTWG
ncbi:hypothetical protein MGYG_06027 [Nannizzia gypsea CBS 118893]|uniref:F-box domain-containing protein n=1 Tax=Arthroderma gypseum (strain ATCC MYA-4604 / CBS 118893) TaxID=535722 RepID=E4V090_ARTGP|nr:hypothetical protein MGYG_06027 [Nannizzia gypsea CBS 118893]EFR03027.1 hypothetical protein MGYG_06027 [Nannizzia gypsea CBS 118893]